MSIRHALLALLHEGPKYGLQLRQEFEEGTGDAWPLNVGQVYTTLQRLERDGLIEAATGDGPQRAYRLTAGGAAELDEWLHTPPAMTSPPRDELVIKLLIALRLPEVDITQLLQVHRRQLVELMQQYTRLKEDAEERDLSLLLVVDAELFRLDALIRWVDAVEARLKRLPADLPLPDRALVGDDSSAPPDGGEVLVSLLRLDAVSKIYGDGEAAVHALEHVDLEVAAGSLVAVMGPSGSGKSTLLSIAGTLEDATSGEVFVDGVAVSSLGRDGRARLRRRSIGYVFQDFNLLPGLTVIENVTLPMELDGVAARRARPAAAEVLDRLGVADKAERFPDDLSGGERQRVAIARAIAGERRLLFADEPTGALDSVNGEQVMRLLRAACQRGVAGVMVTHDAQMASWADRIVFLRDGRVVDQTASRLGPESLVGR